VLIVANQFAYKDHKAQLARKDLLGEAEAVAVVMVRLALLAQWDTLVLPARLALPVLKAQSGLPVLPARLVLQVLKAQWDTLVLPVRLVLLALKAQWDTLVLPVRLVLPVLKAQSGLPVLPARLALLALKDLLVYFPEISQATCHLMGLHCLMAMLVLIVMPALQGWEHLILM
jgi:hypothetical protein